VSTIVCQAEMFKNAIIDLIPEDQGSLPLHLANCGPPQRYPEQTFKIMRHYCCKRRCCGSGRPAAPYAFLDPSCAYSLLDGVFT
jgi:hypothetical protein